MFTETMITNWLERRHTSTTLAWCDVDTTISQHIGDQYRGYWRGLRNQINRPHIHSVRLMLAQALDTNASACTES